MYIFNIWNLKIVIMKKVFFSFFMLFSFFFFFRCSSDDHVAQINYQSMLLGKWKVMTMDTQIYKGDVLQSEEMGYPTHEHAIFTLEFKSGNDLDYYLRNLDDVEAEVMEGQGTYRIEGKTLFITIGDEGENYCEIVSITATNLTVQLKPDEFTEGGENFTRINYLNLVKL